MAIDSETLQENMQYYVDNKTIIFSGEPKKLKLYKKREITAITGYYIGNGTQPRTITINNIKQSQHIIIISTTENTKKPLLIITSNNITYDTYYNTAKNSYDIGDFSTSTFYNSYDQYLNIYINSNYLNENGIKYHYIIIAG